MAKLWTLRQTPATANPAGADRPNGHSPFTRWRFLARAAKAVPLAPVVVAGMLVAACGGGPSSGVASLGSSTSTTIAPAGNSGSKVLTPSQLAAMTKFAQCVRTHGFPKFPDPPYSNGELNGLGFTKQAITPLENGACHADALAAGTVETPAELQQRMAAGLKVAQCMRSHGITNFPDPSSNGGFLISAAIADEPGYAAASKACGAPPAGGPTTQATK